MLWGFDIRKKKGAIGEVMEPTQDMVKGFFSVPIPFECDITPRSEAREKIMRVEFAKAEKEGIIF